MAKKGITFYEVLVYVAYAFFILMGLTWFVVSLSSDRHFNYQAFSLMAIFGAQAYFHHKLTNLILGILSLMLSIFMLLQVIEANDLFAKGATVDGFEKGLLWFCFVSIIMSVVLIFSYTKLSFKEQ